MVARQSLLFLLVLGVVSVTKATSSTSSSTSGYLNYAARIGVLFDVTISDDSLFPISNALYEVDAWRKTLVQNLGYPIPPIEYFNITEMKARLTSPLPLPYDVVIVPPVMSSVSISSMLSLDEASSLFSHLQEGLRLILWGGMHNEFLRKLPSMHPNGSGILGYSDTSLMFVASAAANVTLKKSDRVMSDPDRMFTSLPNEVMLLDSYGYFEYDAMQYPTNFLDLYVDVSTPSQVHVAMFTGPNQNSSVVTNDYFYGDIIFVDPVDVHLLFDPLIHGLTPFGMVALFAIESESPNVNTGNDSCSSAGIHAQSGGEDVPLFNLNGMLAIRAQDCTMVPHIDCNDPGMQVEFPDPTYQPDPALRQKYYLIKPAYGPSGANLARRDDCSMPYN